MSAQNQEKKITRSTGVETDKKSAASTHASTTENTTTKKRSTSGSASTSKKASAINKAKARSAIKLEGDKTHIKMILKSYDKDALRCGLQHVLNTLKSTGSVVQAVIRMPVRRKLLTVNRGPHIDKTSREQFELKTHKCTIYVTPNSQTMDVLRVLCLPSAVGVTLR